MDTFIDQQFGSFVEPPSAVEEDSTKIQLFSGMPSVESGAGENYLIVKLY